MKQHPGTINSSNCLVAGYGRIGKILAASLKALGANVTVAARKKSDLAWISASGYKAIDINKLKSDTSLDLVFNTVPSMIFDAHTLKHLCEDSIVIDLASKPGGVDFDAAKRMGIEAIHALSLPGKVAPKRAGEIIKDTIYNMLEEDYQ